MLNFIDSNTIYNETSSYPYIEYSDTTQIINSTQISPIVCKNFIFELYCKYHEYQTLISSFTEHHILQLCDLDIELFSIGCIKNIIDTVELICSNNSGKCVILANSSYFGKPCDESTHGYKVNYICIKNLNETTHKSIIETSTTPKRLNVSYNSSEYLIEEIIKNEFSNASFAGIKNIFDYVKEYTDKLEEPSSTLINTANILINRTETWKNMNKMERSKSVTLLMDLIEEEIFKKSSQTNDIQIETENIVAELKVNKELKTDLQFPSSQKINANNSVHLRLKEPKLNQTFLFMVYSNINEFLSDNEINRSNTEKNESKMSLNTKIISFKMDKDEIKHLKEFPIELTFQHLTKLMSHGNHQPKCSYWYYKKDTYEGEWRSDDCRVKITNKTHTVCSCNHLTHFAVLMDIYGVHENIELAVNTHAVILKILTIVLSAISMICIVLLI